VQIQGTRYKRRPLFLCLALLMPPIHKEGPDPSLLHLETQTVFSVATAAAPMATPADHSTTDPKHLEFLPLAR
jgi:hypothetical protein